MSAPIPLTYTERETYRREVLNIPSPLDDWLLTNERTQRIAFLKIYLMLDDVESEYVTCRVDMEHDLVSITVISFSSYNSISPRLRLRASKLTACTLWRSLRLGRRTARGASSVPAPCSHFLPVTKTILPLPRGRSGPKQLQYSSSRSEPLRRYLRAWPHGRST